MPIDQSLVDDHQESRETLQKHLNGVSLAVRMVNDLALTIVREAATVEARASSLIEASYSPDSEEDVPYLSRQLESICDDRERAMRECEVIQGHMGEVAKSLKIIENIENGIFEKANPRC